MRFDARHDRDQRRGRRPEVAQLLHLAASDALPHHLARGGAPQHDHRRADPSAQPVRKPAAEPGLKKMNFEKTPLKTALARVLAFVLSYTLALEPALAGVVTISSTPLATAG